MLADAGLERVLRGVDRIANALDAVGDLVVAEGVYQLAQGNHARAAAAVSSLGTGTAPPRPEIVDTPRSGNVISHRLVLQIEPIDSTNPKLAPGWEGIPLTPRAEADPSLNYWLGNLFGRPDEICALVYDANDHVTEVTTADLKLQPIDLFAILGRGFDEGITDLLARIIDVFRPDDVDDERPPKPYRVDLNRDPNWDDDIKSFRELAPMFESAWELITHGRAANAHDWILEETAVDGGALASGCDDDELQIRVNAAATSLRAFKRDLAAFISDRNDVLPEDLASDPQAFLHKYRDVFVEQVDGERRIRDLDALWARRDECMNLVEIAGGFGIPHSNPGVTYESRTAVLLELLEKIEAGYIEVASRVQRATDILAHLAARPTESLLTAAKAVFGESFVVLPQFTLRNPETIAEVIAADLSPKDDLTLDGWIQSVAAVRSNAARLSRLLVLADAFDVPVPSGPRCNSHIQTVIRGSPSRLGRPQRYEIACRSSCSVRICLTLMGERTLGW